MQPLMAQHQPLRLTPWPEAGELPIPSLSHQSRVTAHSSSMRPSLPKTLHPMCRTGCVATTDPGHCCWSATSESIEIREGAMVASRWPPAGTRVRCATCFSLSLLNESNNLLCISHLWRLTTYPVVILWCSGASPVRWLPVVGWPYQ